MPRIRFTADPKLPRDLAHLGFRKGDEVELSDDHANRWLRRGVAVVAPPQEPEQTPEPAPVDPEPVPAPAPVILPRGRRR